MRTPFWGGVPREEVITQWDTILDSKTGAFPGRLLEIEKGQRGKIGPISVRKPLSSRMEEILGYFGSFPSHVDLDVGFHDVVSRLGPRRLVPLRLAAAQEQLPQNTNSGLPRFTRRSTVRTLELEDAISDRWQDYDAVLGWRGSASGPNEAPKQRTVWMFPYSTNIVEMSLFRPMQRLLLQSFHQALSAWRHPEDVDNAVSRMLKRRERGNVIVSTDFSRFDQSVGPSLSAWAFKVLEYAFQIKYHHVIQDVMGVFHEIGLRVSEDNVIRGKHGVPSGSVFTNLVDSVVHLMVQYQALTVIGADSEFHLVQGDDGVLMLNEVSQTDALFKSYEDSGLEINLDKQFLGTDDCLFLQKYHHVSQIGGIYPTYRALNSLLGQERYYDPELWGPEMVSLRAIMILENCKHHPLFRDFVSFYMSGDRMWKDKGRRHLERILGSSNVTDAAKISGLVPVYNRERRLSRLRSFATVQVIGDLL